MTLTHADLMTLTHVGHLRVPRQSTFKVFQTRMGEQVEQCPALNCVSLGGVQGDQETDGVRVHCGGGSAESFHVLVSQFQFETKPKP